MNNNNNIMNITLNPNPEDSINKSFIGNLTKLFNEHILLNYPNVKTFDIEQGLFTSNQYGSYKVPCYDKDKYMVCYIICDVIMGDYKVFKV
jgi:hypothetical protein